MRDVGTVNFDSGQPQPASAGPGRAGGTAKNPPKRLFGNLSSEGK
jgi:hypothetical protein